jgi:hypothetical protein
MKQVAALLSALFNPIPVAVMDFEEKKLRNFSLQEALACKEFKLRCGLPFKTISLCYMVKEDNRPRVLIQVEGMPMRFCYYDDGIWNESDYSDYDLVMVD